MNGTTACTLDLPDANLLPGSLFYLVRITWFFLRGNKLRGTHFTWIFYVVPSGFDVGSISGPGKAKGRKTGHVVAAGVRLFFRHYQLDNYA